MFSWLALNTLAFIFAGQTWWVLQINAGDHVTVVTGSGFEADRSISAILMFGLASLLFVAFSRGWAAVVITAFAAAASTLLAGILLTGFAKGNIGGMVSVIEKQKAIAVEPILSENPTDLIAGSLQTWAWLALAVVILLALLQTFYAMRIRSWVKAMPPRSDRTRSKSQSAKNNREPQDNIALWDSQRE